MAKYGHGGIPGTPFMTIFGIYVSIPIPNIEKFEVNGSLWTPQILATALSLGP